MGGGADEFLETERVEIHEMYHDDLEATVSNVVPLAFVCLSLGSELT